MTPLTPEAQADLDRRYFKAICGDGITAEWALELTKGHMLAEATERALRERPDSDLPYPLSRPKLER